MTAPQTAPPTQLNTLAKIWREIKRLFRKKSKRHNPTEQRHGNPARQRHDVFIKSYCPICQHGSRYDFGEFNGRSKAICPNCRSLERHRFIWMVLEEQLKNQDHSECSMLHFAPEPCLSQYFEKLFGVNYITGDIAPGRAKQVVDITQICFPENRFDYIMCNHVLEHIIEDIKALSELYRVLKPHGIAYLAVPMRGNTTYENNDIVSPKERTKHFGQHDHVRYYGQDFIERVRSVGFSVDVVTAFELIKNDNLRITLGLMTNDKLFIARRIE